MSDNMLVVECPHCEEVFKGQRGLAMHRNHQPDCLKAYLQLSISSKIQKMTGNPRTHHQKERHDTERRNKKLRVDSSIQKRKTQQENKQPTPPAMNPTCSLQKNPDEDDSFPCTPLENTEEKNMSKQVIAEPSTKQEY
jgi:hypothetical protein